MENIGTDRLTELELQADDDIRKQLAEAGKWTKFISVTVFLFAALLLFLVGIYSESITQAFNLISYTRLPFLNELGGRGMLILLFLIIILFAALYYLMYRFSAKIKKALATEQSDEMTRSFSAIKLFFIITTVLACLSLVFNIYSLTTLF